MYVILSNIKVKNLDDSMTGACKHKSHENEINEIMKKFYFFFF
jgi:hypothetical protein